MNWEWLDGIPYFVVTVEWASSQGRGSRITFFINQFTPSLKASPPKKEICEGKTTVSSYLKRFIYLPGSLCRETPKSCISNFLF